VQAYEGRYQTADVGYQDLSERHVAELKKSRIGLGTALGLLAAAGVGIVIGRAIP